MKIGVSSYSFAKYIRQTGATYEDICDIAKKIGYDGIEFINMDSYEEGDPIEIAKRVRAYCEKIGLEITAYTVGANFLKDDIQEEVARVKGCIDVAEALGAPVLRHDACYAGRDLPHYTYREAIQEMAPYIREVTEYAAAKGIKTCTENHGHYIQEPERVEELIRTVNHPNYGWLVDIGNFICTDAELVHAANIAAPYAVHAHVKDFLWKSGQSLAPEGWGKTRGGNYIRGTVISHGVVPISQCLEQLKKVNYDGYISVEFEGWEENIQALETSYAYLTKLLAE